MMARRFGIALNSLQRGQLLDERGRSRLGEC